MAKLTEKDIIAWDGPEDDYMNAQHLEFFRNLLTKQQDEIINKADATTDRMQHDTASAADPADRASQEEEYALKSKPPSAPLTKANTASATTQANPSA